MTRPRRDDAGGWPEAVLLVITVIAFAACCLMAARAI